MWQGSRRGARGWLQRRRPCMHTLLLHPSCTPPAPLPAWLPDRPTVIPLPPACCLPCAALQLKKSLEAVLAQPGARRPTSVRFFRGQMQTIISRALSELDITPMPSRRCFALMSESSPVQCWQCWAVLGHE